jgi:hypothetical protein
MIPRQFQAFSQTPTFIVKVQNDDVVNNAVFAYAGGFITNWPTKAGLNNATPTTIKGFYTQMNALATNYGLYGAILVVSSRIKINFYNREAFPVVVILAKIPSLLGASFPAQYGTDLRTIAGSSSCVLGAKTLSNSVGVLRGTMNTQSLNNGIDTTVAAFQGNANVPSYVDRWYVQTFPVDGTSAFTGGNGVVISYDMTFSCQGLYPNLTLLA